MTMRFRLIRNAILFLSLLASVILILKSYLSTASLRNHVYEIEERLCENYQVKRMYDSLEQVTQIIVKIENLRRIMKDSPHLAVAEYLPLPGNYRYTFKDLRHILPLAIATIISDGDILDLAIDLHTTQVLRNIAKDQKRFLLSIENDASWVRNFNDWNNTDNHLVLHSDAHCVKTILEEKKWSSVSVDHLNVFRHRQVLKLYNTSQIVVIYNTEPNRATIIEAINHYEDNLFTYCCKSKLTFEDGTFSAIYLFTNFKEKYNMLGAALNKLETNDMKFFCNKNLQ